MKALKTVGMVVGVVALAASAIATGGATLGLSAGLISAASTVATISSFAALGIGLATAALAPKPSFSREGNALNFQTNPQSGLPYAIGRTRMSGLRIHADTYDGTAYKSEGKQDVLSFAVMLSAGGAIEGIEKFRADKEEITFNASTGMANGKYADWMAQKWSLGLAGASALALAFGGGGFPGWSAQHKLSGITHALWDLRYDAKGEHFGAGVPEPEWIGKWVKVYDPRKDSTYPGGSGSHRALDESTYEWSNNPALHALTWALGRWQNGKRTLGIGAPIENIRVADFVEAANVADVNGWTCGGVEWSTDPKWTTLKRMLQAGGAEPTRPGAMIGCRVNTPRVSIATVTGADLLDSLSIATTRSRRDRFNTVIPRYRSEEHEWEVISGSPVAVPAYITEDGAPRTKEIDFPLVQAEAGGTGDAQAGQLAAYEIVNSREAGPIRFTTGPKFIGVKTGDVVTLDVPDEGLDAQPVLIRSRSIDPATFKITFEAETETASKHDFALGKTTVPPPTWSPTPPDLTPPTPNPGLWSMVAGSTGDGVPALIVEGACEFPGADVVLIEYRKAGDTDWIKQGKFEASEPIKHIIAPVDGEADYQARIAYQSGDRLGDWLVLGTATTPAADWSNYIESANDRNPLIPDTPGGMSTPQVVRTLDSGNVTVRCTFTFTASPDPADKNSVDFFELGVFASDDDDFHTMGTSSDEVWTIVTGDLPSSSHPTIFLDDRAPNKYYTFGVRAVRKVHSDISATGWVKSAIRQLGTPFRPAAAHNYTGNIGGVSASEIAEAAENFNQDNDRNALTPPAATSVGLSSVTYPDSTAALTVTWAYTHSTNPAAANNIDGFLVGLRLRTSSAGYSYNSSDDGLIRWESVEANLRTVTVEGKPANYYYTAIVIPYRRVDLDVAATGIIKATAAQSSPSTPHQPAPAPNFTGKLDGETATNVKTWSGYANAGLNGDGTVKNAKVLTGSILDGAINEADWVSQGATITLGTNDGVQTTYLTADHAGERLIVQFILDYQITMSNPDPDDEATFTVQTYVQRIAGGAITYSDEMTLGEVWTGAVAVGSKKFGRRTVALEYAFDGLTAGAYNVGYQIATNATCGVTCRAYRYLRADDKRADQ